MKQDNFYITTPIYYPSGQPHMGHAYSSIIADVFARFKRNDNYKVYFLTGTDEHGLKIQKAAEKAGSDPLIYCNKISKIFKDLTKTLNLSNDDFIRTTEKRHYKSVNDIWNRLVKSGDIAEALRIYRWFMPLLELDISPQLVQNIKLAEVATGLGTEYVRAPRLVLQGAERERVQGIIDAAMAVRPELVEYKSL